MTDSPLTPAQSRQLLERLTAALREEVPETPARIIEDTPGALHALTVYVGARYVEETLPPSDSDGDAVFWEAAALLLSHADAAEVTALLEQVLRVQDSNAYHMLAPLLRSAFFPSMLEPTLLEAIQSEEERVRDNARQLDYYLFQARSHFQMSPQGRLRFDELAALDR